MSRRFIEILTLTTLVLSNVISTSQLDVVTFNIRYENTGDSLHWDDRRGEILDYIEDFHIIGLQEAERPQLRDLMIKMPHMDYYGVGRLDGAQQGEFNPIIYDKRRFVEKGTNTKWLSEIPVRPGSIGWDAALPRIATIALFLDLDTDKKLLVINTHFDHLGDTARYESARIILNTVEAYQRVADAVIVLGDLNVEPYDKTYGRLYHSELDDAYDVSDFRCASPKGTYTGFIPDQIVSRRIDYVFVKNMNVRRYCHYERTISGLYMSDHLPVEVRLDYK